jgi:hypothetical protein
MPEPPPEPSKPLSPGNRVLRNVAGALLLLAGITDLFLPILQGVLMIVGGLLLIDLPIKGKAHRWLLRYAFYRRLAQRHDALLARWRQR